MNNNGILHGGSGPQVTIREIGGKKLLRGQFCIGYPVAFSAGLSKSLAGGKGGRVNCRTEFGLDAVTYPGIYGDPDKQQKNSDQQGNDDYCLTFFPRFVRSHYSASYVLKVDIE
jgi:hypothetical protein